MTPTQTVALITEWTRCREWVLGALTQCGGTHTEEDVLSALLLGKAQLWPGKNSAIVTEINITRIKALHFWLVGGNLEEVKDMEAQIEAWAKSLGCTVMTASGRKGWERTLPHWKVHSVTISREI
jgi:hypothetical protein